MSEQEKVPWDVENVYRKINPIGRWQLGVYLLHCTMYTTLAYHYMAFIFQVDTPSHHCAIPVNQTKNDTIPQVLEGGEWVDDKCHMYINRSVSNKTIKCTQWQFDPNSGYISTIVTDFNLVCGKNILVEIQMMISNLVLAVCQIGATKLADMYGRKKIFMISVALRFLFGMAKAFSPNMITYILMDAFIHVAMTGFTATLLVMSMELFPTEYRSLAGTTLEFAWFVSIMLTAMLVWLLRSWRTLQIVMYAPLILGVFYYWLTDESLPWLAAKKRYTEAEHIIRRGARINKVPITPDLFDEQSTVQQEKQLLTTLEEKQSLSVQEKALTASTTSLKRRSSSHFHGSNLSLSNVAEALGKNAMGSGPAWVLRDSMKGENGYRWSGYVVPEKPGEDESQISVSSILRSRKMIYISAINFLLWFTNSIVYTVLNLTVTYLSGDRYLNFTLLNLAELPAIISFHWALNRFGRRWPICIYHIICGVALILTLLEVFGVVQAAWLGITLNFVGKFAITASYCAILVFAPELYPTNVRSMFFGLCWFWAYIAQLVAPYCRPLELAVPGLVRGSCGVLSIIVGLLVLLMPETFMRPFPKTVTEIEAWTRTVSPEERQRYENNKNKDKTIAEGQAV